MALTVEEQLKTISKAWGKQSGYVFFPWIDGSAADKAQRIRGYNEGRAFRWPKEKEAIAEHLEAHKKDDIYWCPSIFEKPQRKLEFAMDEHCLWADLDEVDPAGIDEVYKPTIAWETSPGRYQALWLITGGDLQGASWPGNENQRLTYLLGADHSGWDTTQLLRIPGWRNHKWDYKEANDGKAPRGKLLWSTGPKYPGDHFTDLPEVRGAADANLATDLLEDQIAAVDRLEVWGQVRLKCSKDVRELVSARSTGGEDRSDKLWQIERDLADAGLTVPQIVAIVRETVWNKFAGRNDELRRLVSEAAKAIGERSDEVEARIERDREEKPAPRNLFTMVKEAEPPTWLVKGVLTKASCGFFAGEPKSFKSWCALDLALSVATGAPFLEAFDVVDPGPVLYIQEEDPLPTLKDRLGKVAPQKTQDRVTIGDIGEDGVRSLVWAPAEDNDEIPPIAAIVREQFTISDPGWQAWLDETLTEGYWPDDTVGVAEQGEPYKLLVVDTMGTTQGEVDENRAAEINLKVLTPLRQMAEKHGIAVQLVHHLRKGREGDSSRAGQRMLGSVALHAWSESSMYFSHGRPGTMLVETESKHAQSLRFNITNLRKRNSAGALVWAPEVKMIEDDEEPAKDDAKKAGKSRAGRSKGAAHPRVGQGTRKKIARFMGMDEDATQAEVRDAWEEAGHTWGDWEPMGGINARSHTDDDGEAKKKPGRKKDPNPPAMQALRRLTDRKARAYSTDDVNNEMAKILGVKATQTTRLKAYQQLRKLWETDVIDKIEKNWMLHEVTASDLDDAEVEDLV